MYRMRQHARRSMRHARHAQQAAMHRQQLRGIVGRSKELLTRAVKSKMPSISLPSLNLPTASSLPHGLGDLPRLLKEARDQADLFTPLLDLAELDDFKKYTAQQIGAGLVALIAVNSSLALTSSLTSSAKSAVTSTFPLLADVDKGRSSVHTTPNFDAETALFYCKYAHAAYSESDAEFFAHIGRPLDSATGSAAAAAAAAGATAGNTPLVATWQASSNFQRASYFFADASTKSLIVGVRGTKSLHDVFTNAATTAEPFLGGHAHAGMVRSARRITDAVLTFAESQQCIEWCERYQLQKIALVGHSLGAGTAALSTMLLHRHARPPPPAAVVAQQSSSKTSARSLMDSLSSLFRRNAATPSGETKADSSVIDGQAMAQPAGLPSAAPGSASARFPLLATRCFGFGPPACVAGDFGGLEQHIHSFVLGDDLVPRLTTATFQVIRDDLLLYLEKGSVAMINAVVQRNLRSGVTAQPAGGIKLRPPGALFHLAVSEMSKRELALAAAAAASEPVPQLASTAAVELQSSKGKDKDTKTEVSVASVLSWLSQLQSQMQSQAASAQSAASAALAEKANSLRWTPDKSVITPRNTTSSTFADLTISRHSVAHHLASSYEAALESLANKQRAPQ